MATGVEPMIGRWYETDEGEVLTVLAVDKKAVEVRFIDGTIDAIDLESWSDLNVEDIEVPAEWRGSMDDLPRRRRP